VEPPSCGSYSKLHKMNRSWAVQLQAKFEMYSSKEFKSKCPCSLEHGMFKFGFTYTYMFVSLKIAYFNSMNELTFTHLL